MGHSAKIQREDTDIMVIRHPAPTTWSRRDVLRGSAAALMGAYGLAPRYGLDTVSQIALDEDWSALRLKRA